MCVCACVCVCVYVYVCVCVCGGGGSHTIAPAQCVDYTFWTEILKDLETSGSGKEKRKEKGAHLKDRAFCRDYIFLYPFVTCKSYTDGLLLVQVW